MNQLCFSKRLALLSIALALNLISLSHAEPQPTDIASISNLAERLCSQSKLNSATQLEAELGKLATELRLSGPQIRLFANATEIEVARETANSLLSERECKIYILGALIERLAISTSPAQWKICQTPSNGIERYNSMQIVTQSSGWMSGGYSQTSWCNNLQSILKAEDPKANLTVISSREDLKNTCPPFNCPSYNYSCSIKVESDPVYRKLASPDCP